MRQYTDFKTFVLMNYVGSLEVAVKDLTQLLGSQRIANLLSLFTFPEAQQ